ncbi:MAG: hypothetical protein AAF990_13770 [Bacteroidota bacterium]
MHFLPSKKSYLSLVLLLFLLQAAAQNIGVFDEAKVVKSTKEYEQLETTYDLAKDSLTILGKTWLDQFKVKADKIIKRMGCASPVQMQQVQEDLVLEQSLLLGLETFISDTLPLLKVELTDFIQNRIQFLLKDYCKTNNLQLVLKRSQTSYYDPDLDISSDLIQAYALSYSDPQSQAEWQSIVQKTLLKYRIQQKLRKEDFKKYFKDE